jgi:hypothetical protein
MVILYIYSTCWRMKSTFYECQQPPSTSGEWRGEEGVASVDSFPMPPNSIRKWPRWWGTRAMAMCRWWSLRRGGAEEQLVQKLIWCGSICQWGERQGSRVKRRATNGSGGLINSGSQQSTGTCIRRGWLRRERWGGWLVIAGDRVGWGGLGGRDGRELISFWFSCGVKL